MQYNVKPDSPWPPPPEDLLKGGRRKRRDWPPPPETQARDICMKDKAFVKVLRDYEEWIDVTGAVGKYTSWYFELQSIIEDAYNAGRKAGEVKDEGTTKA